jgi:Na+(H+)/acetate symporter ActP
VISLNIALVLGTAGLPHILIRFLTVPDARHEAAEGDEAGGTEESK